MTLRLRLTLILGTAFIVIWVLAAAWMLRDLRMQMMFSLDQRLVASARMVAGLVDQLPQPLSSKGEGTRLSADQLSVDGMACQVSSLRGEILARSHNNEQTLDDQRSGFHDQTIDGARWRSFTYAHGDVRITTADRHQEREALNRSILLAASAPVLMALLGSLGLLWMGVGKGLAPLNRMRDALRRRSPDSLEPLQVRGLPSELQPLLETQNQLFLRIGQTIERERRLTDDAAHELRSPLTAIKTHLQVARMTDGEVREQALEHAEQGADRLHRTLEQLLLLARVEGRLSFEDGLQCNAEQIARQAIQDTGIDNARRIDLQLAPGAAQVYLGMPTPLAVTALRNLLDNALRHTRGSAPVELAVQMEQDRVAFLVRDHGPGIADQDLEHLTERFWRNSQSGGCGLGLAIVQAIVQRCAGSLRFDSRSDGLRVLLQIPLRTRAQ
ncbi:MULTISPECIES: ATP-binding protein [Pseudomonas]|uniref:ATP-binding protein n=1 Tax=Pseudomonas TaxID=286 RepID=UPI0020B8FA5E|nr:MULTISPECIES: ATP-binding protein [Pseudomonas]MCP3750943.1 ATP-binding protein [Pseudomonas sp. SBB6]MCP6698622.1 ATP-binding protein [Pseudomonas donghuensis]WSE85016.1 ATP-binding protein [Pseudomonas donghuensis]